MIIFQAFTQKLLRFIFRRLAQERKENLIYDMTKYLIKSLPARDSLIFLFKLDNYLYVQQGRQAIRYEGGIHTKHRHLRYHDFFVDRITTGEKVLDIGCGIGALAYDIADQSGAHVTGIDINPRHVAEASRRYAHPRIRYRQGDACRDIDGDTYDVVIMSNVLEHLIDRSSLLKQISKENGNPRFLIRVPLFDRDWRVPLKKELGLEWRLDPTHQTEYTVDSFLGEIKGADLTVNHMEIKWSEIWAEIIPHVD